jgi:hypothetical protein
MRYTMAKKVSRSSLVKKLDTVFSQYIRQRYAESGIAICITCGKQDEWKKLQAGHFMSRRHYSTRWNEDNVQVQCYGCNVMRSGEQYLYSKYLGETMSITLLNESRKTVKFADVDLLEKIEYYKSKI